MPPTIATGTPAFPISNSDIGLTFSISFCRSGSDMACKAESAGSSSGGGDQSAAGKDTKTKSDKKASSAAGSSSD